jgi:hypothetical protein
MSYLWGKWDEHAGPSRCHRRRSGRSASIAGQCPRRRLSLGGRAARSCPAWRLGKTPGLICRAIRRAVTRPGRTGRSFFRPCEPRGNNTKSWLGQTMMIYKTGDMGRRLYSTITYYRTGLLILDHSYLVGNLTNAKNCRNKSFITSRILTLLYQQFSNLLISQRDMSGPRLGALPNNRWSGVVKCTTYKPYSNM